MFTPEWRNRLLVSGAIILSIIVAFQIAAGSNMWAIIFSGAICAMILSRVQPVSLAALALGIVVAGYIIGNRGFAQLSLAGGAPLLPAEFALLVCVGMVLLKGAAQRELPFRTDPLNTVILLWMLIGTIRVFFDFRQFGFNAIRDYAMVYYAALFFVAQYLARDPVARRFLFRCFCTSGVLLLIIQPFYQWFPDFFFKQLTVRGNPLIYYKGDLLATFLAMTAVLYFLWYEARRKHIALFVSLISLGAVLTTNNRASLLGLIVATVFLAFGRRWRFALVQLCGGAAATVMILLVALAQDKSWESTPVYEFYERIASVADPFGKQTYKGSETSYKGENNAFRTVWWKETITETMDTNPWAGMGFGYDLADQFVKKYYPTNDDEFNVRSPHNIWVTVFARMGLIGLLPFFAIIVLMAQGALRAVARPAQDFATPALWCNVWVIFTSACFGVVLEGPMGAVIFWTLLGLAHQTLTSEQPSEALKNDAEHGPRPRTSHLQPNVHR